jgi:hypothetical protein
MNIFEKFVKRSKEKYEKSENQSAIDIMLDIKSDMRNWCPEATEKDILEIDLEWYEIAEILNADYSNCGN